MRHTRRAVVLAAAACALAAGPPSLGELVARQQRAWGAAIRAAGIQPE